MAFFSKLECQSKIIFQDISSQKDLQSFPRIDGYCNQSCLVDFHDIQDNTAVIDINDTLNSMVVFLYKGEEVILFTQPNSTLSVSLNEDDELVFTGNDAACHESFNAINKLSRRYFYDYTSNLNFSSAKNALPNIKEQVESIVFNELSLLDDMLREGGCEGKMHQYYYTDLFCSFVYQLGRSNVLQEKTLSYVKALVSDYNIDLSIVKGVTSNLAFYSTFYGEYTTELTPSYKGVFLNPNSHLENVPDEIRNYLLQTLLILNYRFSNDAVRLCENYQRIKSDLAYIYFEDFFRSLQLDCE